MKIIDWAFFRMNIGFVSVCKPESLKIMQSRDFETWICGMRVWGNMDYDFDISDMLKFEKLDCLVYIFENLETVISFCLI